METTDHGDHMGTFWGLWGQHEDDGDDGDDVGMMGMMWGRQGPLQGYTRKRIQPYKSKACIK